MGADGEKDRISSEITRSGAVSPSEHILPVVNPAIISEKKIDSPASSKLHPAFYVATWITLSSSIIIFNKWILDDAGFHYPIVLTCWHLTFATLMTQILARTTTLLDGRKTVKMTGRIYVRAILPIGAFFSLSLICGNMTYLYLGVAFIQMLKATTPVAVLLAGWAIGTEKPSMNNLFKVSFIVIGVIIASFGEIEFVLIGFLFQLGGIVFEALRLVMVQKLLSSAEYKMDPLVSLYYFAPLCAIMNFCVAAVVEIPSIKLQQIYEVGLITLLANAVIAFALNVSVVFLVSGTSPDRDGMQANAPRLDVPLPWSLPCAVFSRISCLSLPRSPSGASLWRGFNSSVTASRWLDWSTSNLAAILSKPNFPMVVVLGPIMVPAIQHYEK
ncbi:MAG: hypothetical protein L6R42_003239 [Xanthoria sp. 1 TBL-2021]|nr:MAG: hypothetical protein L6R42_003239 [Xanthoria sp. 1 TBL-2021]